MTPGSPPRKQLGSHRIRTPGETLALIRPFQRSMGITRVANVTGLDRIGIPTVVVTRPNARSLSVSQGKGCDLEAAKASGLMEAIELHHAENNRCSLRLSSHADLASNAPVADVGRLPRYIRRFDAEAPILWTLGRDLHGNSAYVPFDMVHANLTLPLAPVSGFFPLGSNGLASGNSLAEAVAHGLWELIERDAIALFYRMPVEEQLARRLDLESVDAENCRALLQRFRNAEVHTAVWDLTSDIGIPAFYCSIIESELSAFHPVGQANGFGCHLDRAESLKRALTEAAQSRLTRIAGSRDDIQREDFERLRSERAIRQHQAAIRSHGEPTRRFDHLPTYAFDTVEQDLAFTEELLARCDIDHVWHVDLSDPELPIHVVRVVVPGLEGLADAPGYVPGQRALARVPEVL